MGGTGNINAGATKEVTLDVSKTGYRPLGIIGFWGSGTGNFAIQEVYITNSTAHYFARNISGSSNAITYLKVDVLYVKT